MRLDITPEHVEFLAFFLLTFPAILLDLIVIFDFPVPLLPDPLLPILLFAYPTKNCLLIFFDLAGMPLSPFLSYPFLTLVFVPNPTRYVSFVPFCLKLPLLLDEAVFLILKPPFFSHEAVLRHFLLPFATDGDHSPWIQGTVEKVHV